jgi:hypothetical protein
MSRTACQAGDRSGKLLQRHWPLAAALYAVAVAVADPTVTFYAVDLTEINPLAMHLAEFAPRLPPGVVQRLYVEPIYSRR